MILLFVLSVLINLILCFQQETKNGADFNMNRNNLTPIRKKFRLLTKLPAFKNKITSSINSEN